MTGAEGPAEFALNWAFCKKGLLRWENHAQSCTSAHKQIFLRFVFADFNTNLTLSSTIWVVVLWSVGWWLSNVECVKVQPDLSFEKFHWKVDIWHICTYVHENWDLKAEKVEIWNFMVGQCVKVHPDLRFESWIPDMIVRGKNIFMKCWFFHRADVIVRLADRKCAGRGIFVVAVGEFGEILATLRFFVTFKSL